jgi:hypothetical protein
MSLGRLLYRTRQFWQALRPANHPEDLELAASVLTAPQLDLFLSLPSGEQAHGLRVLRSLLERGERDGALLTAALLHDAGKSRCPLRPRERALVVLVEAACPGCLRRWGSGGEGQTPHSYGWRRPFVVAVRHPAWGADLALAAGADPETAALILRHQERLPPPDGRPESEEERRLRALQAADDNS